MPPPSKKQKQENENKNHIDKLPPEILVKIFGYLDNPSLAAVAETSKRFHAICEDLMSDRYETIQAEALCDILLRIETVKVYRIRPDPNPHPLTRGYVKFLEKYRKQGIDLGDDRSID